MTAGKLQYKLLRKDHKITVKQSKTFGLADLLTL